VRKLANTSSGFNDIFLASPEGNQFLLSKIDRPISWKLRIHCSLKRLESGNQEKWLFTSPSLNHLNYISGKKIVVPL
jgi:hypothetical protein